ncbi:hypothetical protein E4T56_gene508 [Termitomyces sp. T112]|nr:hypothetical protein E4T56_gene508 [Termitomyces sp. T112]
MSRLLTCSMQLALAQVLNKLDVVQNQRDEAWADLFQSVLGKGKCVACLPNPPEAKKACTEPSVFVEESSTQRAPLVPHNDVVPAGDDQKMDEHPDFKAALFSAGPSKPVAAQAKPLKPAAIKEGTLRPSTKQASITKPAVASTEADDSMVIATLIAFPANIPQGSEAGMIEVLKSRTYVMPSVLPQEVQLPVQWDPYDKEFFITQQSAAQAMAGAPAASDSGNNDDDDVPMSK